MCRDLFNIPDNDVKQAVNAENLKSFTQNGCVNRLASILFFISEGTVTKEEIKQVFWIFLMTECLL